MDDSTLINGLLAKRAELSAVNADLRERMAVVANDIEAVERVLHSLGYQLARASPLAPRGSDRLCSIATSFGSTC